MRLLLPTVDFPPIEGGISTVCVALARELHAAGHEVTVAAPWFPGMEAHDAALPYRVERFKGYGLGWARLLPFLQATMPLAQQADAILAINIAYGGVLARLMQARQGTPYVCLAYAYEFMKFHRAPPARWLLRNIYDNANATIAISQFTRDSLVRFGVNAEKIQVAYPGADLPARRDDAKVAEVRRHLGLGEAPFVLSAGRFIARKNHIVLVEAWPRVLREYPDMHLVMAGRGPERDECIRRVRMLGLDARVHCPGYMDGDALDALMHDCTFFAMPNGEDKSGQVEGFGLVFAEAAVHGKAVIAGDSGGAREAVVHGETGLLVPPGDGDALVDALLQLLRDDALRERMGAAGMQRVNNELSWARFTQAVLRTL